LTDELHLLDSTLHFNANVTNITIIGLRGSGGLATIECTSNSGIEFATENGHIEISNTAIEGCRRRGAALYFDSNTYGLHQVTVQHSGIGVYAYKSKNQEISHCKFLDNDEGHLKIIGISSVSINGTIFYNGSSQRGAGVLLIANPLPIRTNPFTTTYFIVVNIIGSVFMKNRAQNGSNLYFTYDAPPVQTHATILIKNCTFSQTISGVVGSFGVVIHSTWKRFTTNITVVSTNFTDNQNGGVVIHNARSVIMAQCYVSDNEGTGIQVARQKERVFGTNPLLLVISHVNFLRNARALVLHIILDSFNFPDKAETLITDCVFAHNSDSVNPENQLLVPSAVYILGNTGTYFPYTFGGISYGYFKNNIIRIQNSKFLNNSYRRGESCSSLYLNNVDNITVGNSIFENNSCSAVILNGSFIKFENKVIVLRNHGKLGGGFVLRHTFLLNKKNVLPPILKFSRMIIISSASIYFNENTALDYGGGIYTDEACGYRRDNYCFFQFESTDNLSSSLNFANNHARLGGDAIFGGCLSNCSIKPNKSVDFRRHGSIFWDIVSLSGGNQSQSFFAEHPYRVVLCKNKTPHSNTVSCLSELRNISVYRGETFPIEVMSVGSSCFPSSSVIIATVLNRNDIRLGREQGVKQLNPYCDDYLFSLLSDSKEFNSFSIKLSLSQASHSAIPVLVGVEYKNYCPSGFELDQYHEKCVCSLFLASNGIVCNPNYSLTVPSMTWIGSWHGHVAVGPYCQHCKVVNDIVIDSIDTSDKLCAFGRKGLICGGCIGGFSVQLGGYECRDCSKSNYKGILLMMSFAAFGFALVFFLLRLNFTVSTGLINSLIFYSNIVYSNHAVFLPISRDTYKTQLDNLVRFFYVFQAWTNLDFGFDICFIHGIDTYAVTWLQFVFPVYVWLLIFSIVVISRYSTRLSKFTGHNTISVLATLLLLSYTKLLLAILSASSYTRLYLVSGMKSEPLWSSDANVKYMTGKHVGLFLMAVVMALTYILPFTFIIVLGPVLQTYSHCRGLQWIVRIKPFLDAFYGPYTVWYRYWPGIMLLLRLVLLLVFAFYSLGDESFIAAIVAISTSSVLLLWLLWGKTNQTSLHRNRKLNFLEAFFLFNLSLFAILSVYFGKNVYKRQILAVVMVGSAFLVFCGILTYHIVHVVKKWTITVKILSVLRQMRKGQEQERELAYHVSNTHEEEGNNENVTHTTFTVEPRHFEEKHFKNLREPLIES
jgi:predicted outer membrane repeat protein